MAYASIPKCNIQNGGWEYRKYVNCYYQVKSFIETLVKHFLVCFYFHNEVVYLENTENGGCHLKWKIYFPVKLWIAAFIQKHVAYIAHLSVTVQEESLSVEFAELVPSHNDVQESQNNRQTLEDCLTRNHIYFLLRIR